MSPLLLLSLSLLAPRDSAQPPLRPVPAVYRPVQSMVEASRCPLGFCPSSERRGLPPGVMFLATGLVAVGVAGLVHRGDKRAG